MADPEVRVPASSVVLDHVGCLDSGTADTCCPSRRGCPASPRIDLTAPWEPTVEIVDDQDVPSNYFQEVLK